MGAWKCYRCNLTFTEESHVVMHQDIENHPLRKIKLISIAN